MLDLLDEKFIPTNADLKKIYYCVEYNYQENDKNKKEMFLNIYTKFGICNYDHFIFLLEMNNKKPINKFSSNILEYFNKEEKIDYYHNKSDKIFLQIIDNPDLKIILTNDVIDKIISKFDLNYEFAYDFDIIKNYIVDNIEKENENDENDDNNKLKKKSKKIVKATKYKKSDKDEKSDEEEIKKETKKETKYTKEYISNFYAYYMDLSKYIFNKSIDLIDFVGLDNKSDKKSSKKSKDISDDIINEENKKEKNIIDILYYIYAIKFDIKQIGRAHV